MLHKQSFWEYFLECTALKENFQELNWFPVCRTDGNLYVYTIYRSSEE